MKKFLTCVLSLTFVFSLFTTSVSAADGFPDLDQVKWAKDEILYLHEEEIINGLPDGTFGPKENVTRAQVAVMLVRDLYPDQTAEKTPPFDDLSETAYYYDEIAVAYGKGIIKGDGENMRPKDSITRAEAVVMVDRAYDIKRDGEVYGFPDADNIPWATESILDLTSQHIINGTPDGTFNPFENIIRASFAKVLAATIEPSFRSLSERQISQKVDTLQDKVHTTLYDDLKEYGADREDRNYQRIEEEIAQYATGDFSEEVERAYYDACLSCDTLYYFHDFAWDIHTNVIENNRERIIVETAQPESFGYLGSFETITLLKVDGKWKLDAIDGKRFDDERHLDLTVDQAEQRIADEIDENDVTFLYTYEKRTQDLGGDYYYTNIHVFENNEDGSEIEVDASTGGILL
ncbi:S-layer homology domain-containing protein [Halobacillus dabanensis]|uniref:S-layer homology domain-containing protein n=1 Tax=Halobacillus dabanensis TaxID=240302 RepID=A0A1I3XFY5_HALDA|nr:S-layer homology domain-containing protein [Halobacillus dabanensis]SFK18011.1 S-layer homology domain-containing protein [Halobacillus dabanensis]